MMHTYDTSFRYNTIPLRLICISLKNVIRCNLDTYTYEKDKITKFYKYIIVI
jgi:hypothetical protein